MRRLFVVFVSIILLFATGCQSVTIVSTKATESNESIFSISDESIVSTSIAKGGNIKESVYIPTDNYNTTDNNAASLSMQQADDVHINADPPNINSAIESQDNDSGDYHTNGKNTESTEDTSYPVIIAADGIPTLSAAIQGVSTVPALISPSDTDPDNTPSHTPNSISTSAHVPTPASTPIPTPVPIPEPAVTPEPTVIPEPTSIPTPSASSLFQIDENKTLIGYTGTETNIIIPDDVLSVGAEVFKDNDVICSVTIPASVTHIYSAAFKNCTSLKSVHFSDNSNLLRIWSGAFEGCICLSDIDFPKQINRIDDSAFKNCPLSDILTFYSSVEIGANAFENTSIQAIASKYSGKNIALTAQPYAFAGCTKLSCFDIACSNAIPNLAENSFFGVNDLTVYVKNNIVLKLCKKDYSPDDNKLGLNGTLSFCTK